MTFDEVMAALKQMGTAQNVKVYLRHGAGPELFGVSFANLATLTKKIKVDHALAEQLWQTGNTDAQTLALMIADPKQLTASQADTWLREITYHMLTFYLAKLVADSPLAFDKLRKWTKLKKEHPRECGYQVLSSLLKDRGDEVSDDECRGFLKTIEAEIHGSPNRARYAMNGAVIAIGVYKDALRDEAIAVAKRIGKVEVDHGETNCTTPDAASYILKAVSHPKRRRVRC